MGWRLTAATAAGLLGALIVLPFIAMSAFAVTMIAADVPTTVQIAPGATAGVPWSVQNTGGAISGMSFPTQPAAIFQAPSNSSFAPQTTVSTQFSGDGGKTYGANAMTLTGCVLSNGNRTLSCNGGAPTGASWPANGIFRFNPLVTVDAAAPDGVTLTPGTSTFGFFDTGRSVSVTTSVGTLNVKTPPLVTMIAADVPATVTIAPGATGTVPWSVQNTGGAVSAMSFATQPAVIFQAPNNTTFAAQTSVTTQFSSDGGTTFGPNAMTLTGCVLSNGNRTLSCNGGAPSSPATNWPANGIFRFNPLVTVDPAAPPGTMLTPGTSTFQYFDTGRSVSVITTVGTLNVQTPAQLPVPLADPRVVAGASLGVLVALAGIVLYRRRHTRQIAL